MTIEDVIKFASKNGNGKLFSDWTESEVKQHLCLHAKNKTLMVAEEDGVMRGFATYRRIKEFTGDIVPHFWEPNCSTGEHVYFHELCSAGESATYTLFTNFEEHNKDANKLIYWGHRQYNLKRYRYKDFKRLMLWANRNHQHHQT